MTVFELLNQFYSDLILVKRDSEQTAMTYKISVEEFLNFLVKEKIKLFPLWYNSTTSNEIIQGIGRGVRFDGDWCVSYILDACFWKLYLDTQDQYSNEFKNRLNII